MGLILKALDEDDAQKAAGHILFITQARKTDDVKSIAQTPSMTGKLYPTNVVVMSVEDEEKSFVVAVDDLVKVLYRRGSWQYSVPTFVHRGNATPPSVPPTSKYLINEDSISFIMKFYKECETNRSLSHL